MGRSLASRRFRAADASVMLRATVSGVSEVAWSVRAAGQAVGVHPTTVRRWIDRGDLAGAPPWAVKDLAVLRDRSAAAGRQRGLRAAHGTLSRYAAGCSCELCRAASAARQREREKALTDAGLPAPARERLIELAEGGLLLTAAAAEIGVSARKVLRTMARHPDWGLRLQAALDDHRPDGWDHGHRAAFRHGCRCSDCLTALRASANRSPRPNTSSS